MKSCFCSTKKALKLIKAYLGKAPLNPLLPISELEDDERNPKNSDIFLHPFLF